MKRLRRPLAVTMIAALLLVWPAPNAQAFHTGLLPNCGGGVTELCLVSFTVENAAVPGNVSQIKFQFDNFPGGGFFVMAWNTGGTAGQEHELGPTLTSASKLTVKVKPSATFDPTALMSMGKLESWSWNAATRELTVVGFPASGSWTESTCSIDPGVGCDVQTADFDFNNIFMFDVWDLDPSLAPPEFQAIAAQFELSLFGGYIATNAQTFSPPNYNPTTKRLEFFVGGPHCRKSSPPGGCTVNVGEFLAFIPNAFISNIWQVDPGTLSSANTAVFVQGQGSGTPSVTAKAATASSPAGVLFAYSGFTFSAPKIEIATVSSVVPEAPVAVPTDAAAGPVNTTRPVQVPQTGVFAVPVTVSRGASVEFAKGTTATTGGAPFRGVVYPPFPLAVDPTGRGVVSIVQLGVTGVGAGADVILDRPATLTLIPPATASASATSAAAIAYQPVDLDAPGGPQYLIGRATDKGIAVDITRLRQSANRFGLAKVPRPAVTAATPAIEKLSGFHSRWAGQAASVELAPGQLVDLEVRLLNAGTDPWVRGEAGREARLGSSAPLDNTRDFDAGVLLTPVAGTTRFATTVAEIVQPGEIGSFAMRLRAPLTMGTHRVHLRPVIEGTTWMEDQGIFIDLTVR